MSNVRIDPKAKVSQILEKKRRENPIGLITAQRNGTMAEFLADDLKAAGINPASLVFGGKPNLNAVGETKPIVTKSVIKGEPKPLSLQNQTISQHC